MAAAIQRRLASLLLALSRTDLRPASSWTGGGREAKSPSGRHCTVRLSVCSFSRTQGRLATKTIQLPTGAATATVTHSVLAENGTATRVAGTAAAAIGLIARAS